MRGGGKMSHPQMHDSRYFDAEANRVWVNGCWHSLSDLSSELKRFYAHIAMLKWTVAGRPDIADQWAKWGSGEPWETYPKVPESEFFRGGHFRYPGELVADIATASGKERKLIAIVAMHECRRAFRRAKTAADAAAWQKTKTDWFEWGGLS